jgi:hypothetical protein
MRGNGRGIFLLKCNKKPLGTASPGDRDDDEPSGFLRRESDDDVDDAEIDVVLGRTGVPVRRRVMSALHPKADVRSPH